MPQLKLPPSFTATPINAKAKPTRIAGTVINVWHEFSPEISSTSQHVYLLEIVNSAGTSFLIRLWYSTRDYRPLRGMRMFIELPVSALKPLYELPGVSDTIIAATAARLGASIFPERDSRASGPQGNQGNFSLAILTPYNDVILKSFFDHLDQRDASARERRQMTFTLFADWIKLRPKEAFTGYISAIISNLNLTTRWQKGETFCMPCPCGNVVFSNKVSALCTSCESQDILVLQLSPQILGSVQDETGGFGNTLIEHNILVAENAWTKLLGCSPESLASQLHNMRDHEDEVMKVLYRMEQRLTYARMVFVVGWTGRWNGGRMVVLDVAS